MTEAERWEERRLKAEGFRDGVGAALEIVRSKRATPRAVEERLARLFWDYQRELSFQPAWTNGDRYDTQGNRDRLLNKTR